MIKASLKYTILSAVFLIHCLTALGQDIKSIGVPYIQNFPKSTYLSGNQNWSVAKGQNGILYFGNAQGLLSYDGKYWQQYQMPNRQIVRSVATAGDKIYTGGFGEFGYWTDREGKLTYTSLTALIPKPYGISDEIWKIYVDGKRVIFQSFRNIYIYQDHKISLVSGKNTYLFLHQVGKRFYVEILDKGLFELNGNKLTALKNTGTIQPAMILSILAYKNGRLLVGTSKERYNQKSYVPFGMRVSGYNEGVQQNIRVLRFADVLLMNAEAANELGDPIQAKASLNRVRQRARGGNPAILPDVTTNDKVELRNAIWHERQVELAMENDRYFDVIRQGRGLEVFGPKGWKANKNEVWPIPAAEIDLSGGLLTQNPGYN